jgi:alkanesulfonate monooxygenase SsuD/methylene tetrahydromethanopterin reductase-like flavin-dependent oxidoreductase (luciferase family)
MQLYRQFHEESGEGLPESGERIPQTWIVGDVDHCVEELGRFIEAFGITDIVTMAVPPGLRPEQMTVSLEALFTRVVPRLRSALAR